MKIFQFIFVLLLTLTFSLEKKVTAQKSMKMTKLREERKQCTPVDGPCTSQLECCIPMYCFDWKDGVGNVCSYI